jgi:predicted dehydrogenase
MIYCDKPLTATLAEAEQIGAALGAYRGAAQMVFHNRFYPATLMAKKIIDEGRLGEILEFRGDYLHSGSADPTAPLKWKLTREAGGGTVADLGSHLLDLITHLLGDFSELAAATHIAYPTRRGLDGAAAPVSAEDNMHVIARLANGAVGSLSASKLATGAEDEISFSIHGSKGALKLAPLDWHRLYFYDATGDNLRGLDGAPARGWTALDCGQRYAKPAGFPAPKSPHGWLRGHVHCLYNFLDAAHRGAAPAPDLARGVYIQRLIAKIHDRAAQWDAQASVIVD